MKDVEATHLTVLLDSTSSKSFNFWNKHGFKEMSEISRINRSKEQCDEGTAGANTNTLDVLLTVWVDGRITGMDKCKKHILQ